MQAEYREKIIIAGQVVLDEHKTVQLPFKRITARALICRRADGALLGALHHPGGRYALPGGSVDDGEQPHAALLRELREENITPVGLAADWQQHFVVDYYAGYGELSIWYVMLVSEAQIGTCDELVVARWVLPHEDVWHPNMRHKIALALKEHLPSELLKIDLQLVV